MSKRTPHPFLKFTLVAAAGGLLLYGLWSVEQTNKVAVQLDPDNKQIVQLGKTLYQEECAACHGSQLEGEDNWKQRKPNGRLPAPPHDANGHTWHHPEQALFAITKFGPAAMAGTGNYQSDMPAYKETLSDEEIIAILSFIKSRWPAGIRMRHDEMERRVAEGG